MQDINENTPQRFPRPAARRFLLSYKAESHLTQALTPADQEVSLQLRQRVDGHLMRRKKDKEGLGLALKDTRPQAAALSAPVLAARRRRGTTEELGTLIFAKGKQPGQALPPPCRA